MYGMQYECMHILKSEELYIHLYNGPSLTLNMKNNYSDPPQVKGNIHFVCIKCYHCRPNDNIYSAET